MLSLTLTAYLQTGITIMLSHRADFILSIMNYSNKNKETNIVTSGKYEGILGKSLYY